MVTPRFHATLTPFRTTFIDDLLIFINGSISLVFFGLVNIIPITHILLFGIFFTGALVLRHSVPDTYMKGIRIATELVFFILLFGYLISLHLDPDNFFAASFYLVCTLMSIYSIRIFSHYEAVYFLSFPIATVLLTGSALPLARSFIAMTAVAISSLLLLVRTDWSHFTETSGPANPSLRSRLSPPLLLPLYLGVLFLSLFIYLNLEGLPTLQSPFRLRAPRADATGRRITVTWASSISPRNVSYSGFSSTLRLSSTEIVHLSEKPVLRVRAPFAGYWRGVVFSEYTGRSWNIPRNASLNPLIYSEKGRDHLLPREHAIRPDAAYFTPVSTQFEFLTDFTNVLPTLYMPDRITLTSVSPFSPLSYTIYSDDALSLRLGYLPRSGFSYTMTSLVPNTDIPFSSFPPLSRNLPPFVVNNYLALPRTVPDRVRNLARSLTKNDLTPLAKVRSLSRYLSDSGKFTYTLKPPPLPAGADPVDFFLFESRSGYCEIYAASLGVLLRSVGIPSRVIGGFMGGEYDIINGSLIVRERDAHAWVEAYIEPWGWITLDPTPEAPGSTATPSSDDEEFSSELSSTPLSRRIFRSRLYYVLSILSSIWNSLFLTLRSYFKSLVVPAIIALAFLFFLLRRPILERLRGWHRWRAAHAHPIARLLRMIESRSGIRRQPAETVRAFFARLSFHYPNLTTSLHPLRNDLEAFLYGHAQQPDLLPSVLLRARSIRFDKSAHFVVKKT